MIDKEIVATRLSRLREALRWLRDIAAMPRAEFLASAERKALSEHFLRIALEAMLDVGNHVIAEKGLRKPLRLREIPVILAEHDVLGSDLGGRLAGAVGLRNRLVHGYAENDHALLHETMRKHLTDLEGFAVAIGALVGS